MLTPLYKNYVKSEAWGRKKLAYYKKHGHYCKACFATEKLHVHHMTYDRLTKERLTDLVSLCYPCHAEVHKRHRAGGRRVDLKTVTLSYIAEKTRDHEKPRRLYKRS